VLAILFAAAALSSKRHIALFLIYAIPLITDSVGGFEAMAGDFWKRLFTKAANVAGCRFSLPVRSRWRVQGKAPSAILAIVPLAFWAAQSTAVEPSDRLLPPSAYPQEAVASLVRTSAPGNVLCEYGWGGFFLYHAPSSFPVFIDGRCVSVYRHDLLRDYLEFVYGAPGWQSVLDHYGVRYVLWPSHARMSPVGRLLETGQWRVAHSDPVAVVLERAAE
jgi:hypothetical protein